MSASEEQIRHAREIEQLYEAIDAHDAVCPCRHLTGYICRECQTLHQRVEELHSRKADSQ